MMSRHPTTGAPIRILRSDATLSKNANTIVWIQPTFEPSPRWSRWNTIVSDPRAISVLQGHPPSVIIIRTTEEAVEWNAWCSKHSNCDTLLLLTTQANAILHDSPFMTVQISELNQLYPFLQGSITTESPCEHLIAAICHILRMNRLVTSIEIPYLDTWKEDCKGTVTQIESHATDRVIPHTWWISQFYEPSHPSRARELRECLDRNILCPYIDHILLLTEQEGISLPSSEKLVVHPFGKRATYANTFQIAIDHIPKGDHAILIFSNSDIWFDTTLRSLWSINLQEKICLSLLRWEGSSIFGPRPDSQDTWILGRDTLDITLTPFEFHYGIPGCDNIVSLELLKQKYLIVNPAYTIKTYHNHASSIRSYHPRDDILYRPVYLYIHPTAIQSFATTSSFGSPISSWNSSRCTFSREVYPIRTASLSLAAYTPPTSPVLYHPCRKGGLFVSPQGLLYDFQMLWVNDYVKELWSRSSLHTLSPTLSIPSMIALAGSDSDPARWMVYTFPTILRIQQLDPTAQFIMPPVFSLSNGLRAQPDIQYWSPSVWTLPARLPPPTQEDIALLRSYFKQDSSSSKSPSIVFLVDDNLLSLHHAEQMAKMHCIHTVNCETTTRWNIRYIHATDSFETIQTAMAEADWVVSESNHPALLWIWRMKPGGIVLEFQTEHSLSEEIPHLAGAASLKYILGVQRFREPIEDRRQQALLDLGVAIQKYGMASRLKELASVIDLPVITLPTGMKGIHAHSGDSFRAMIQLWKDRGYCQIEPTATPFCWWGGFGETLLYDRDTMKWMDMESPSYKLALVANPSPTNNLRQSKWSYWPRYPALVETVLPHSWKDRSIASIFLGRIENGVQKKHRETADWKSVIELFECPIDSTGGPYKYSPSEYLDLLCKAKFGLCLAGFGQKCHREIEYYACGTVPIATPECDMTGYLNSPIEGVHYFRASTPEDVRRIIATTSRGTWDRMSHAGRRWWHENASAEGLFRLTVNRIRDCLPYAGIGLPR
jgi:hypothetical protein